MRALVRELTEAVNKQTGRLPQKTEPLSKRLLFVDDEESIRATLPLLLQQRGFDVRVAANVSEALSEIRTHDFDVLLSDLNIGKDDDGFTVGDFIPPLKSVSEVEVLSFTVGPMDDGNGVGPVGKNLCLQRWRQMAALRSSL